MTQNVSERIDKAIKDIEKIQILFRQKYGEECLADKEIEEVLKIAKAEHEELQQYRSIGMVEEVKKSADVRNKVTEIVNRQLVAGKNNFKETYDCFWEIVKVVQENY